MDCIRCHRHLKSGDVVVKTHELTVTDYAFSTHPTEHLVHVTCPPDYTSRIN